MTNKSRTHILRDRLETCKDFTFSLLYLIENTYLGNDYIKTAQDIEGHFNWCYMKVLDMYYKEELDFYENNELYEYFFSYYLEQLYKSELKPLKMYERFWNSIFNTNSSDKRSQQILVGVYGLFEKSFQVNSKKKFLMKIF